MLLLSIAAVLGAYVGLTRSGKLMAVLTSGGLTACLYAGGVILAGVMRASGPAGAALVERSIGDQLFAPVAVAMATATVCGLISASRNSRRSGLYLADDGAWRPDRRKRSRPSRPEALGEGRPKSFGEMLNR